MEIDEIKNSNFFKNIKNKERAAFELGIKLGSIFHQFIGVPVSKTSKKALEKCIEKSISEQPFVESVEVSINSDEQYRSLKPEDIESTVVVKYKNIRITGKLKHIEKLDYPLMWIENIKEER